MYIAILGYDGQISATRVECEVPNRALALCGCDGGPVARIVDGYIARVRSCRKHARVRRRQHPGDVSIGVETLRCLPTGAYVPQGVCCILDDNMIVLLQYCE